MDAPLNIKQNPYVLLLFTTMALLFALAFRPMNNIDFKDITMYSIPLDSVVWAIPLVLMSLWLFYSITGRFLYSRTLYWLHVLVTVITTLLIAAIGYFGVVPSPYAHERHELIGSAIQILSLLFILGQSCYIANVLAGLFRKHAAR